MIFRRFADDCGSRRAALQGSISSKETITASCSLQACAAKKYNYFTFCRKFFLGTPAPARLPGRYGGVPSFYERIDMRMQVVDPVLSPEKQWGI